MAEISIIVPVYNEAEYILPFYYELKKHTPKEIELIWVDDGSTDSTLAEIEQLITQDSRIRCISLTRNFGQKAAISAGIDFALAPTIILMSGNLKHPPSMIPHLLEKLNEGYEIVNAYSNNHAKTLPGQRQLLNGYYKFLDFIAPARNNDDITIFRAFNDKVSEGIRQLKERNLFLGNFFNWSGYNVTATEYSCAKCSSREKKYSFEHLKRETLLTINHISPKAFKSLFAVGILLTSLSAYAMMNVLQQKVGSSVVSIASVTALLACSIYLLAKSKVQLYHSQQKRASLKTPKYLVKDIIEQDHSYYKMSYELLK